MIEMLKYIWARCPPERSENEGAKVKQVIEERLKDWPPEAGTNDQEELKNNL